MRLKMDENAKRALGISLILAVIVLFGFFLRTYYVLGVSVNSNFGVSGGSDSFYHERVIQYIVATGHQLIRDPLLNYPVGANDPRPPFFEWSVVSMAYFYLPFVKGMGDALGYSLILISAIFGALIAIPTYLMGSEAFNRRVGIISALLIATSASNMMRSMASWGGYDVTILFFAMWAWYFFLKAVKTVKYEVYVDNYFNRSLLIRGIKNYFANNKRSLLYSSLAGISFGTIVLMWQGFAYVEVIILLYVMFQVLYNRVRNISSFHLFWITLFLGLFAYPLAIPFYYVDVTNIFTNTYFSTPLYIWLFVLIFIALVELTNKIPWTLTLTVVIIFILGVLLAGIFIFPEIMIYIYTGEGYFVKTPIYATIAEAQSPTLGVVVMSVGVGVFFLWVGGLFLMLWDMRKNRAEYYLYFIIFSLISVYMAFAAARFIYEASPAFIIPAAYMFDKIVSRLKVYEMASSIKELSFSWKSVLKRGIKWSKVVSIILIAFLIILPNMWAAVDSAIPFNTKVQYDQHIYNVMPSFLRPQNYTPPYYLGAYGVEIDNNQTDPWVMAFQWLSTQDTNYPPANRPGFISWWDYGFQEIEQGQHPTVADNFQYGYQIGGQALMAQNESQEVSLYIARLLDATLFNKTYGQGVQNILIKYLGESEEQKIIQYYTVLMKNPAPYIKEIVSNPNYYGNFSANLSNVNAKYIMVMGDLSNKYSEETLVNLYISLERYTGLGIEYFATDYRLFPLSGMNTGIFYAPAYLSGRVTEIINGEFIPIDFYNIVAVDVNGNIYPLNRIPANAQIVNYEIEYKPMFFKTMLYRAYVGYSGMNLGMGPQIPGLSTNMSYYPIMPAWNLTHFEVVYSMSFWNPYKNYQNHSDAWRPVPLEEAYYLQKTNNGTVVLFPSAKELLQQNVIILKFYPGAIIEGRVTLPNGQPLANVLVTLDDQYGIPHSYVYTNSQGYYKLYAVAGNDTIIVSTDGGFNSLYLTEKTILASKSIYVSNDQALRIETSTNEYGMPNYYIIQNFVINQSSLNGMVYYQFNKNSTFSQGDIPLKNAIIYLVNSTYKLNYSTVVKESGYYSIENIIPHQYNIYIKMNNTFSYVSNITLTPGENLTKDIPLKPGIIQGLVLYENGTAVKNATLVLSNGITVKSTKFGEFTIYTPPGHFKLYVIKDGYYANPISLTITTWGMNITKDITLQNAYNVTLNIYLDNQPVQNAMVRLIDEFNFQNIFVFHSNNNGIVNAQIPYGYYSVYILYSNGINNYAYIGNISANQTINMSVQLKLSYPVYGYVYAGKFKEANVELMFLNGYNFIRLYTNSSGYYLVYLPVGIYNVGTYYTNSTGYYSYYTRITVSAPIQLNLYMSKAFPVNGTILYGVNRMKMGIVFLEGPLGIMYETFISPDGDFHLYPNFMDYNVSAIIPGYYVKNITVRNNFIDIYMNQQMVRLIGYLNYSKYYNGSVELIFQHGNSIYKVRTSSREYSIYLPPGGYNLSIQAKNLIAIPDITFISVNGGQSEIVQNISIDMKAKVTISPYSQNVYWFNDRGNIINYGNNVTLPLGYYNYYIYKGNLGYIGSIFVNTSIIFETNMVQAYIVDINILNYTGTVNLYIDYNHHIISKPVMGKVTMILPEGFYHFYISQIVNETIPTQLESSYYAFIFMNMNINIYVKSHPYLIYLTGNINSGGYYTNIFLFGNYNYSFGGFNHYNISIYPGHYVIYAYSISGIEKSYIGEINVMESKTFNITLWNSSIYYINPVVPYHQYKGRFYMFNNTFNISLYYDGIPIEIVLKSGNYSFYGTFNVTEYGVNVEYVLNKTYQFGRSMFINPMFERVNVNSILLNVLTPRINASVNQTLTYYVEVLNKGNLPENVTLESVGMWNVTFNETKLFLMPSQGKVIKAYYKVQDTDTLGLNYVQIRAIYGNGLVAGASLVVNVSPYHKVFIKFGKPYIDGNNIVVNFTIYNHGNVNENVTFGVINSIQLYSLGWKSYISNTSGNKNYIIVYTYSSKNLTLILTPYKAAYSPLIYIGISLNYSNMQTISYTNISVPYLNNVYEKIETGNISYVIPNYAIEMEYLLISSAILFFITISYILFRRVRR